MKKEYCNCCAFLMVLLAICVILVLIYYNKKSLINRRVEGFDDHNNMSEEENMEQTQKNDTMISENEMDMGMMPPNPTNFMDTNPANINPNIQPQYAMDPMNPNPEPRNNQYQVEYVRPITNDEFQEIFKDFYTTASDLATSTKKMKSLMDEYTQVYEENGKLQEKFNKLKDELQNGIKALA
tara:strand:- start:46 stop:591 length:546 start_codon:yes stop_codon:yes gene_type:complete